MMQRKGPRRVGPGGFFNRKVGRLLFLCDSNVTESDVFFLLFLTGIF